MQLARRVDEVEMESLKLRKAISNIQCVDEL
jgi:hypothetical protein